MQEYLQQIKDYLESNYNEDIRLVACGMVLMVAIILAAKILAFIFFRKKCTGIIMNYEGGHLEITRNAIEEFIIRILADRNDMTVEKVLLKEKGKRYNLDVRIKVKADTNVKELREQIVQIIREDTRDRLGIDRLGEVNVYLQNVNASDSKINRRHKIALHNEVEEIPAPIEEEQPAKA